MLTKDSFKVQQTLKSLQFEGMNLTKKQIEKALEIVNTNQTVTKELIREIASNE